MNHGGSRNDSNAFLHKPVGQKINPQKPVFGPCGFIDCALPDQPVEPN
jgi:hypothetical protein